jgi:hypothetical protein
MGIEFDELNDFMQHALLASISDSLDGNADLAHKIIESSNDNNGYNFELKVNGINVDVMIFFKRLEEYVDLSIKEESKKIAIYEKVNNYKVSDVLYKLRQRADNVIDSIDSAIRDLEDMNL